MLLPSALISAARTECSQQILLHIPYRCGTFRKTLQHKADMVCIQLHESAAHDLRRLVVPCHPQHSAFRRAGIHQKIHDLMDGVLLIRADPEQQILTSSLVLPCHILDTSVLFVMKYV